MVGRTRTRRRGLACDRPQQVAVAEHPDRAQRRASGVDREGGVDLPEDHTGEGRRGRLLVGVVEAGVRAGRVVGVPAGLGHCGETAQALRTFGLQDRVNHLTADGAAMRGFLTGSKLRGLQVLLRDPVNLAYLGLEVIELSGNRRLVAVVAPPHKLLTGFLFRLALGDLRGRDLGLDRRSADDRATESGHGGVDDLGALLSRPAVDTGGDDDDLCS